MCGIIGYSGTNPVDEMDFKILFLYSQLRGTQSTGYATKDFVCKSVNQASYFISRNKIPETNLIIGHTRNPSHNTGKTENEAQPFDFENMVAGHNGRIIMRHTSEKQYEDKQIDSDSYPLLHMLSDKGIDKAIDSIYSSSSLALIWIDREDETLNLYRFDKPTFLGQKNGGVYIASQKEYLEAIECENVKETKENYHYVIKDGEIKKTKEKKLKTGVPAYNRQFSHTPTTTKQNKTNKKTYENVPMVMANHAPKDAPSLFVNGVKRYYWIDKNNVAHVESVITYDNSELKTYDLNTDVGRKSLSKSYLPILNKINEMLEE